MIRSRLDHRFARFCRTGDPAALAAVFDGTARDLLHVAVWLAGNRDDAEDLLQRTFLVAIERRDRFAAGRPVVPWLMGILALEARHLRRERSQRPEVEPGRSHDPTDLAAARELDDAVREVSDSLAEPYRDVLRLHLQEGLNAKEIAGRLHRPSGTVRTQLVRALTQLRRRLPRGFVAGIAPAVQVPVQVLGRVRTSVLEAADATVRAGVATTMLTATATGSVTMTKKLAAAAALVLVLSLGSVFFGGAASGFGDGSDPTGPRMAALPDARGPEVEEREEARESIGVAPPAAAAARAGSLLVRVVWREGRTPAPSVGVSITRRPTHAARSPLAAVSDEEGELRFDGVRPGAYVAEAGLGHVSLEVEVRPGEESELLVVLDRRADVEGLVVDERDRPVAGASIWLSQESRWFCGHVVGTTDAAGRFRVPAGVTHFIGARKSGYVDSHWHGFTQWTASGLEGLRLRLRDGAATLAGRVVDDRRQPVAGARVLVGHRMHRQVPGNAGMRGVYEPAGDVLVCDAEGRFESDRVPAGPTELSAWAEGFGPASGDVIVSTSQRNEVELQLPRSASLVGIVRDDRGEPVVGAHVRFADEGDFVRAVVASGGDGAYRLDDLPAGRVEIVATLRGAGNARTRLQLSAGETATWDPRLAKQRSVRGRVLDPDGRPMPDLTVIRSTWLGGAGAPGSCRTDEAGRFAFQSVPDTGVQLIEVRQGNTLLVRVRLPAGDDDLVLRVAESDLPTASVRVRLLDRAGFPMQATLWIQKAGSNEGTSMRRGARPGEFRCRPVSPGRYELLARFGNITVPLSTARLRAREELDLGDLVVPQPALLRVRAEGVDGSALRAGGVDVLSAEGRSALTNPPGFESGEVALPVPEGNWLVQVVGGDGRSAGTARVVVGPEQETTIVVKLRPVRAIPVVLEPDRADRAFGMFRLLVHDTAGRLCRGGELITDAAGGIRGRFLLAPGQYKVSCVGAMGPGAPVTVDVPASGDVPIVRLPVATR